MKIEIKKKRIKNIYIKVDEKGVVKVSAPFTIPDSTILSIIEKKKEKILKEIEKRKATFIDFSKTNKIPYLGKMIDIDFLKSSRTFFEFKNNMLFIHSEKITNSNKEYLIMKWYARETNKKISHFVEKYSPVIGKKVNRITIKKMKTRWGSCNSQKKYLNFNLFLIQKPLKAIEYVVVHELVHLIHPNHSEKFYKAVEKILPDWKKAKETLYKPISSK